MRTIARPAANVRLPIQSMRPRWRRPTSRKLPETPHRAEGADREVDGEDPAPIDRCQDSPNDDAKEGPGHRRDHVDPEGKAALIVGEGVGADRGHAPHKPGVPDRLP